LSQPNEWRVFCAVELPDVVRARLEDHVRRLRKEVLDAAASWSRVENIHVTLKFFGNVEVKRIEKISAAAERVAKEFSTFEIGVGETGVFPRPSRPQVLWIGVSDPSGQLNALHEKFENECATEGFEKENRAYRPHLTIARLGAKAAEPPQIDFVRHCRDARRYTRQRSERSARLARSEPAISQGREIPARLPKRPATRDIAMSGQCHLTVTKVAAHSIGTAPARGPSPATCTGPVHQGRPRKWAHARDSCARHVRSNAVALRWLRLIALDTRWTTLALAGR